MNDRMKKLNMRLRIGHRENLNNLILLKKKLLRTNEQEESLSNQDKFVIMTINQSYESKINKILNKTIDIEKKNTKTQSSKTK